MNRLWRGEEPIDVALDTDGMPTAFTWRGREHRVERIDEIWRVDTDWWNDAGLASRRYVRLTTHSGFLCEIYCDLRTNTWLFAKIYD
jgi:hypothetical protein